MIGLKEFIWPMYRVMKVALYPFMLLFGMMPFLRERPYYVLGVLTMFLFDFLADVARIDTAIGAILFVVLQSIGLVLALSFMAWGQEFERRR